jgi:hypothetical protein
VQLKIKEERELTLLLIFLRFFSAYIDIGPLPRASPWLISASFLG